MMSTERSISEVEKKLLALAKEYGVFSVTPKERNVEDDFVDQGLIDSMGGVLLSEMIIDNFHVEIPVASFVAELRSIRAIADYLQEIAHEAA